VPPSLTPSGRAIGSTIVLTITYDEKNYWPFLLSQQVPTLLFFSTFSVFVYFFARLVHSQEDHSTISILKPVFLFFNLFTYIAFFSIGIYFDPHIYYTHISFKRSLCGLYGIIYLIFGACIMNYGAKLGFYLNNLNKVADNPSEKSMLKSLYQKILIIAVFFSVIFLVKAILSLLFAWSVL
jgi:hypothetical protein